VLSSCSAENDLLDLDALGAYEYICFNNITQDNTGNVTFLPRGEGVSQYEINFGDGTAATCVSQEVRSHKYKEGYIKQNCWYYLNGKKQESTQELQFHFFAINFQQ
jgi:hypothetical protein